MNVVFELHDNSILPNANYVCSISQADDIEYLGSETSSVGFLLKVSDTTNAKLNKTISGIKEIEKQELYIFPNPANTFLNISLKKVSEIESIKIYDAFGKQLKEFVSLNTNQRSNSKTIEIADLKAGLYYLSVDATDGFYSKKFIKE